MARRSGVIAAAKKLAKGVFVTNLALLVRALRFGITDAVSRFDPTYYTINPFAEIDAEPARRYFDRIPEVPLTSLLSGSTRSTVSLDARHIELDGAAPLTDLLPLLALLKDRNPTSVLEIGTYNGTTTCLMALNLPNGVIHTLDLPPGEDSRSASNSLPKDDFHLIASRKVGDAFRSRDDLSNIVQHLGDTADWDFAKAKGPTFFFIDGSHTYEYARNDTARCIEALGAQGGTLVWHDCDQSHIGVVRWLAEMVENGFPVVRIKGTSLALLDRPHEDVT